MGDQATVDGLFAHADMYFSPTWHEGGRYWLLVDGTKVSTQDDSLTVPDGPAHDVLERLP